MRAGSGSGPAPCSCTAAHMLLQHHILTMRHRHVAIVAPFKTLTNKTPPRRLKKRGVKLTCACLHDTENDNSCDGDLVNTRRLPGCNRDATSLVTSLDSRLMQQPAFLPAAVTEQVGSQPVGILGQTVRWDRYRSAAERGH